MSSTESILRQIADAGYRVLTSQARPGVEMRAMKYEAVATGAEAVVSGIPCVAYLNRVIERHTARILDGDGPKEHHRCALELARMVGVKAE